MTLRLLICTLLFMLITLAASGDEALQSCSERATTIDTPSVDVRRFCLERIITDDAAGEMAFTTIAIAPDGKLYATRPLTGEIIVVEDSDGDGLPDQSRLLLDGLTLPNALAFHAGALYIVGGRNLYRWLDGDLNILIDDLPYVGGIWTGGLTVGPDEMLYIGIGASCDFCVPEPDTGTILRVSPDGRERSVIARGLRQPAALAWHDDTLWLGDSVSSQFRGGQLDELNQLVDTDAYFGWPHCIGPDNEPTTIAGDFDCAEAQSAALKLPSRSTPVALAAYTNDTFPDLTGKLLLLSAGSTNQSPLEGYTLSAIPLDAKSNPTGIEQLIPVGEDGRANRISNRALQYQGEGFWPHHPYGLAISAEGWIYISSGGGNIYVLRPID